ncbi:adenylate kinase [Candidatus Omnitrophus magneticus]|uniref:Adenylate kinase n=1 Tax=Candidatus Omnitrophus magneticus TaxID=1609969 RepID=A0A0F0CLY9_9BACT|nr:adenylate kinase [Candidatus Omnitrophus magneticus]
MMDIVLLGPPGAGKGTQAEILAKEFGLLHISTGDMLREEIKSGSELGGKLAEYINRGELAPDSIVNQVVINRMSQKNAGKGVILDGYPRTKVQAESLDKSLEKLGKKLKMVLYFKATEQVVIQRLAGRRVCKKCGKNYHETNMPPKRYNVCDICGEQLFQRNDDKPDTIKNRLLVYEKSTKELIEYYKEKKLLKEIDGDSSADKLFNNIKCFLEK